jgi:hypothetical protein
VCKPGESMCVNGQESVCTESCFWMLQNGC